MCEDAHIWPNTVKLATPTYTNWEKDSAGDWTKELCPRSILAVQSFEDRQKLLKYCETSKGRFWPLYRQKEVTEDDGSEAAKQLSSKPN